MTTSPTRAVLVPGAWMGSWIWEPTVKRLGDRGLNADTLTLQGLETGKPDSAIAAVGLEDHVQQLVEHLQQGAAEPVILISHSYSGMVTASAADRLGDQVIGLIHVGAFLPTAGRSLMDDWGGSAAARATERADIEAADHLWHAPTREMLDNESDLTPSDRDYLAAKFTPHPGLTVLDATKMSAPVESQPSTYIALTPNGDFDQAWDSAPAVAKSALNWRRKHIVSGHWPMISAPVSTVKLLEAEIRHYSRRG